MPKKRKYVQLMTPTLTAGYSYIDKPDSGGQYSDDKYKVTLIIDKSDEATLSMLRDVCGKAAVAEWGTELPDNLHNPIRDGADVGEVANPDLVDKYMITLKTTRKPACYDSSGATLDPSVTIMSGDQVRVAGAAGAYISGKNKGVTLYLNQVQLVEKRAGGGDTNPFGAVEGGFTNEAAAPATEEISGGSPFSF